MSYFGKLGSAASYLSAWLGRAAGCMLGIPCEGMSKQAIRAAAAGSGQCWHWDVYVAANDLWWQFGRFAEAVKGLDPPVEAFEPMMLDHPRLRVYALKGKRTTLLWCRDKENTWETELRDGRPPSEVRGATLDLAPVADGASAQATAYDPWENRASPVARKGAAVELPPFRRCLVIRLTRR